MLISDEERLDFLKDLDKSVTKGVEVTDWEAKFIESQLKFFSENPKLKVTFSPGQRDAVTKMYLKYGSQV